ncbi:hypothetical protein [Rhizobium phaseoli]|nr:hypothetical protein [Rhizobium phaseoli]
MKATDVKQLLMTGAILLGAVGLTIGFAMTEYLPGQEVVGW